MKEKPYNTHALFNSLLVDYLPFFPCLLFWCLWFDGWRKTCLSKPRKHQSCHPSFSLCNLQICSCIVPSVLNKIPQQRKVSFSSINKRPSSWSFTLNKKGEIEFTFHRNTLSIFALGMKLSLLVDLTYWTQTSYCYRQPSSPTIISSVAHRRRCWLARL